MTPEVASSEAGGPGRQEAAVTRKPALTCPFDVRPILKCDDGGPSNSGRTVGSVMNGDR